MTVPAEQFLQKLAEKHHVAVGHNLEWGPELTRSPHQ
jgi:LysM repeat protein